MYNKPNYLYKITNLKNGKTYIGITSNPKRRKYEHFKKKYQKSVSAIRGAISKYGSENFRFEILLIGSRAYVVDVEANLIEYYKNIGKSYNIRDGGEDQGSGHKVRKRSDDKPCYVFGFWFPNRRLAAAKLSKGKTTIYRNLGKELKTKLPKSKYYKYKPKHD